LYTVAENLTWFSHYGKDCGFLKSEKIGSQYYPAIPVLDIYAKEVKTGY